MKTKTTGAATRSRQSKAATIVVSRASPARMMAPDTNAALVRILLAQMAAQTSLKDRDYDKATAARDAQIRKLGRRQRVHAKLCFGILDRLVNPVR